MSPFRSFTLPAGFIHLLTASLIARNLKFYPFSLKRAILEVPLRFLATVQPPFTVEPCIGGSKEFLRLTDWELLNLKPATVLGLPTSLAEKYSISSSFLQAALKPYVIQTTGKDVLEQTYKLKPGRFLIGSAKHYSWPKSGGELSFIFAFIAVSAWWVSCANEAAAQRSPALARPTS